MKTKTSYFILGLVGLAIIYWLYVLATDQKIVYPLTENEAQVAVINQYPELAAYKTTSLPPSRIQTKAGEDGWYVSFIHEGSGIPGILDAKCYYIGNKRDVTFIGQYIREADLVAKSIDIENCNPVIENLTIPPPAPIPVHTVSYGQKIGETKNFGSVSIKPILVEEDSRCPANANCIWAGRVRLRIMVNGNESIVTLGEEFPTENVIITLTEVLPQKTMATIEPSDYRFIFTVTKKSTPITNGKCYVGGCSGQICSDKPDAISTCDYIQSYSCYKTAKCERQVSGACGWTETPELMACLAK